MPDFEVAVLGLVNAGSSGSPDWRYRRIGILDSYTALDVVVRYNDVGAWSVTMPLGAPQTAYMKPGVRLAVWLPDMAYPVISGPLTAIDRQWSDEAPGPGLAVYSGTCDNQVLSERAAWPTPGQAPVLGSDAAGYRLPDAYYGDNKPTSVERFIRKLAYDNFGPGAWAPRQEPGYAHTDPSTWPAATATPSTTYQLRFETLLESLQARVESGDDGASGKVPMGFRWAYNRSTEKIELVVFKPTQNPKPGVRFSREIGNLLSFDYKLIAPKAVRYVMGLQSDDSDHPEMQDLWIGDKTDQAPEWGSHAEVFVDHTDVPFYQRDKDNKIIWPNGTPTPGQHPVNNWDAINRALDADYQESGATASLSVTPINTVGCRIGRDYWLGDRVSVQMDGVQITEVLREIHLTDGPDGPVIEPTIGTFNASETPAIYSNIRQIWKAVERLQRLRGGRR